MIDADTTMTYKGYTARIGYSAEDNCLVGHIMNIDDIVGFHADSVAEMRKAFEEAVDFYMQNSSAPLHKQEAQYASAAAPYAGAALSTKPAGI